VTLAKHPNVYVKLTLVPLFSTAPYPYNNIQPFVRQLVESFGPNRCFWGTDASAMLERTKCTYTQCVKLFTEEMNFLSKSDLEWIMGRGLSECLGWPIRTRVDSEVKAAGF
jgi:Amidohydrolase